ncbi:MAG: PfkB family carbohydrate kinase [Bacteroidales bacterium]|nr:PfkB family carbohydrate kinase [Bacteroidales bacterium]
MDYYAFGESLLDIIVSKNEQAQTVAGGSQLNVAANLAIAGHKTQLISYIGEDAPGNIIHNFAKKAGIGTDFLHKDAQHKTAIAFAVLNEEGQASYSFYKDYPKTLFEGVAFPEFNADTCFSFGSMAALENQWQPALEHLLLSAKSAGSLIFYDPNIRSKLKDKTAESRLLRNMQVASIIRGSDEDFFTIFETTDPVIIAEKAGLHATQLLLITQGAKDVIAYFKKEKTSYPIPSLKPVSTIGAGDAFNSGILSFAEVLRLTAKNMHLLVDEIIGVLVGVGISFAANVCKSTGNTISAEMADSLRTIRDDLS